MANLLKPEKRNRGLYRRCSVKVFAKTHKINLGYITLKAANQMFLVVEELESLKRVDGNIPTSLQERLKKIGPDLQEQLVRVRLICKIE